MIARLALVVVLAVCARADSIQYDSLASRPLIPANGQTLITDSLTLVLPQFDPSIGSLQSIRWTLGVASGIFFTVNQPPPTDSGTRVRTMHAWTSPFGAPLDSFDAFKQEHDSLYSQGSDGNAASPTGTLTSASAMWDQFIGTGDVPLTVGAQGYVVSTNIATLSGFQDSAHVWLTYNYVAHTPEPRWTVLWLGLIAGVCGLVRHIVVGEKDSSGVLEA